MKKYLGFLTIVVALLVIPAVAFGAFPSNFTNWITGNVITSAWLNSVETLLGTGPAKGSVHVGSSTTAGAWLAVGSNGKCLTASSTATYGVSWETCASGGSATLPQDLYSTSSPSFLGVTSTNLSFTVATGTSLGLTGLITTNATATNLNSTTATTTNLFGTNHTFTNGTSTNFNFTTATGTSVSLNVNATTTPVLNEGDGTNASNYGLSVSGGRAMFGYDASGGGLIINAGNSKGMSILVNGNNNQFDTGTIALTINASGTVSMSNLIVSSTANITNFGTTNATSTNLVFTTATGTSIKTTNLTVGAVNGLLKGTAGVIGAAASTDYVSSTAAGTGIQVSGTTGAVTITNGGVTSIVGSSTIGVSNATGTVTLGAKFYPIYFIGENLTASENDAIVAGFRATSTISSCDAENKTTGDTITFGLGYATSRATATSSLFNLFTAGQTVTATTTPTTLTPNASTTPGLNNPLIFWTTAASSSQFSLTCWYSEN